MSANTCIISQLVQLYTKYKFHEAWKWKLPPPEDYPMQNLISNRRHGWSRRIRSLSLKGFFLCLFGIFVTRTGRTGGPIFGRPFVKRFALSHRTVVCPVCLWRWWNCGQMVGWIKVKLGMEVGLVIDPAPPPPKGTAPNFRSMSIVTKRSPWSVVRHDVFLRKDVPFGGFVYRPPHLPGKISQPQKGAWICIFKPNSQNIKTCILSNYMYAL